MDRMVISEPWMSTPVGISELLATAAVIEVSCLAPTIIVSPTVTAVSTALSPLIPV